MDLLPRRRPKASAPSGGPRALFLGSSLTYANDMPFIVQAFARATGKSLDVAVVAQGGASFEDLWNRGEALRRIKEGGWSFVTLPESRAYMREYNRRFAEPIQKIGARQALYMVWPSADRMAYFDDVRDTYTLAAEDVGGMMIPAGEAWRAVWRRDPQASLLKRDGVHPTPAGSFAVALSIFGMLFSRSPEGLPPRVRLRSGAFTQVTPALAPLLQEAAAEANAEFGRR